MSKSTWRNGLAVGLGFGIPLGILLVFFGDIVHYFGDCIADGKCDRDPNPNENNEEPNWWYWTRRAIAAEDTLAQWVMAVFSIAAVGLIWRTLTQTNKTNIAAVKAADAALAANKIMRDDQRPWLSLEHEVPCEFSTVKDFGVEFSFNYQFANKGKSPATDIRFKWHPVKIDHIFRLHIPLKEWAESEISRTRASVPILHASERTEFLRFAGGGNMSYNSKKEPEFGEYDLIFTFLAYRLSPKERRFGYEASILWVQPRDEVPFGPWRHQALVLNKIIGEYEESED